MWSKRGFREDLQYAEDDEYTRWCREQGYSVVYVPESVAMHSHNYAPDEARKRSFGDARAMGQSWQGKKSDLTWGRTVLLGWVNDVRKDFSFCAAHGRLHEFPHAMRVRWMQRTGKLAGFRDGWNAR